jgi:predicted dehydrogenase
MKNIRIGIVGIGNIGSYHVQYLSAGAIKGAELTAVCDIAPGRLGWAKGVNPFLAAFENVYAMLDSGLIDAIIIAVPHYLHPPFAIAAFEKGIVVMSEKPAGVYTKQVREMNEAAKKSGLVFGIMFNQRTTPVYKKLEELVKSGELGDLKRVNYTMSEFYRCQAYYNSGGWRGTWSGEGGGLLLNQCAHNLDIWQRICGVPVRVRAFCGFGKYRDVEVEDEVTAYVEYQNGATGMLISSVSEAPGTNRMELVGDRGKIVVEDHLLEKSSIRKRV